MKTNEKINAIHAAGYRGPVSIKYGYGAMVYTLDDAGVHCLGYKRPSDKDWTACNFSALYNKYVTERLSDKPRYAVIGGQYSPFWYGNTSTLYAAKLKAMNAPELWDSGYGWSIPDIYKIEDCHKDNDGQYVPNPNAIPAYVRCLPAEADLSQPHPDKRGVWMTGKEYYLN